MSGDCKRQPIIFYSEEMTETKIFLLQQHGIKFKKYEYFISEDQDMHDDALATDDATPSRPPIDRKSVV